MNRAALYIWINQIRCSPPQDMKYYTEVIDRSESRLISQDETNRHRRNREALPQPRKPHRAPRKFASAQASPQHGVAALAPL
jgi:hypothetical protein